MRVQPLWAAVEWSSLSGWWEEELVKHGRCPFRNTVITMVTSSLVDIKTLKTRRSMTTLRKGLMLYLERATTGVVGIGSLDMVVYNVHSGF